MLQASSMPVNVPQHTFHLTIRDIEPRGRRRSRDNWRERTNERTWRRRRQRVAATIERVPRRNARKSHLCLDQRLTEAGTERRTEHVGGGEPPLVTRGSKSVEVYFTPVRARLAHRRRTSVTSAMQKLWHATRVPTFRAFEGRDPQRMRKCPVSKWILFFNVHLMEWLVVTRKLMTSSSPKGTDVFWI